jgi:hypothetical protein
MTHRSVLEKSVQYHTGKREIVIGALSSVIKESVAKVTIIEQQYKSWMTVSFNANSLNSEKFEEVTKPIPQKYLDAIEIAKPKTKWDLFNVLTDLNSHDANRNFGGKHGFDRRIEDLLAVVV